MIIPGYFNLLSASTRLFVENYLLYFQSAYDNYSGQLYSTTDPNYSNYQIWGSPFRQWVVDSSVTGAYIPSGVYQNGAFVPRGTSGLAIDYERGRVLCTGGLNNPTAAYAVKEFNCYFTHIDEADLLIDNAFLIKPKLQQNTGALFWNQEPVPAIYFKLQHSENVPWAFGGTDQSETIISAIVIADSPYKLDACCTALTDTARKYFPLLKLEELPFNILGDVKSGVYNYVDLCQGKTDLVMIERVKTSKFSESTNKQISQKCWVALVDFKLIDQREPRRYFNN